MKVEELVGQRIREVRELQELTQEEFGKQLEPLLGKRWPRQTVSAAEKGARAFTAAEILVIAHTLNTTIDRLFQPPIDLKEVEVPSGKALSRREISRPALPRFTEDRPLNLAHEALQDLVASLQGIKGFQEQAAKNALVMHEALSMAKESRELRVEHPTPEAGE